MADHPADMTDEQLRLAVRENAKLILAEDDDVFWCVRVHRMAELLSELHGKPVEHGDHLQSFYEAQRQLP